MNEWKQMRVHRRHLIGVRNEPMNNGRCMHMCARLYSSVRLTRDRSSVEMANKNFPLLNQIDEGLQSESIDWNRNAFQTLLVGRRRRRSRPRFDIVRSRPRISLPERSFTTRSMSVCNAWRAACTRPIGTPRPML